MDEQILRSVNKKIDHIIEQGRDYIDEDELKQQIRTKSNQLRELVRKYPMGSIAAGVTVGFLCAKLFVRR